MEPSSPSRTSTFSNVPLQRIKDILLNLPRNTTISVPAHLGLPFLSTYLDTTLGKLSVLAHHISNPNSSYPQVQLFESEELTIILKGVITGCEMLTKTVKQDTAEAEKAGPDGTDGEEQIRWNDTHFEYFSSLPSEIRRMIWTEALSYQEIIWSGKVNYVTYPYGRTVAQWHDIPFNRTKKSLIMLACQESYRLARKLLIHDGYTTPLKYNPDSDIFWMKGLDLSTQRIDWSHDWSLVKHVAIPAECFLGHGQEGLFKAYSELAEFNFERIILLVDDDWRCMDWEQVMFVDTTRSPKYLFASYETPWDLLYDPNSPKELYKTWEEIGLQVCRMLKDDVERERLRLQKRESQTQVSMQFGRQTCLS
jgi:hypothetical protein